MPQSDALLLTALPNGVAKNPLALRLTVVLTPSIVVSGPAGSSGSLDQSTFLTWTATLGAAMPAWQISLTRIDRSGTPTAPPVVLDALPDQPQALDPGLWTAIFGSRRKAATRVGNHALRSSWRLSHDITTLHYRHEKLRHLHAQRQFQKRKGSVSPDVQAGIDESSPPTIFLYPSLQPRGQVIDPSISANATAQVTDRAAALRFRKEVIDATTGIADLLPLIQHRIDYAVSLLEDQGGRRLLGIALYAIYRHCFLSVITTTTPQEAGVLRQRITAIERQVVDPTKLTDVQTYVELLLFHRRKPGPPAPLLPPPPDFHQLLGLVNHYPAMLRPLGLALDLTVPLKGDSFDGYYDVKVQANGDLVGGITPASNTTVCRIGVQTQEFYSAAADDPAAPPSFISGRCLNLTPAFFNLADEDADGMSLKVTDQTNNDARSAEYTTSAPTSLNPPPDLPPGGDSSVRTPASSAHPTKDLPADRTIGISLFQADRLTALEDVIKGTTTPISPGSPTPPPAPVRLHASDVMLGIRVDVKYNNRWYSLCRRRSVYNVNFVGTKNLYKKWSPNAGSEQDADEGFVTFAAMQSATTNGSSSLQNQTQTQVHQSVFTWTGWSLAVPKPKGFLVFSQPPPPPPTDPAHQYLSIAPEYSLEAEHSLPPLRFGKDYEFRCRLVDLAGNSLQLEDVPADAPTISPQPQFTRHEPIRAPQILLSKPLDLTRRPGEHVDRMVARDIDAPSTRYLVPPRESLRLAELLGLLKGPTLPGSAFPQYQLKADGAFPSVREAREQGWLPGTPDPVPAHEQDAVLLRRNNPFPPANPYYPDPNASYILVVPFLVSDDPTVSRPLGEPFYLDINPANAWPDFDAARIRLEPAGSHTSLSIRPDDNDLTPGLVVTLPEAATVVLLFSSAADHPGTRGVKAGGNEVHLYAYNALVSRMVTPQSDPAAQQLQTRLLGDAAGQRVQSLVQTNPAPSDPVSYVDGTLDLVTPTRTLTLVHAVRRPLSAPDFAPRDSAWDLSVSRAPGESKASVTGAISAHWLSTGKITCHAQWTDQVDDLKKSAPGSQTTSETAFDYTFDTIPAPKPDFDSSAYLRTLVPTIHNFRDTRAHAVTYSLTASTRFSEYYPQAPQPTGTGAFTPEEARYTLAGASVRAITVLSSVRPPAPTVSYLIPAFHWRETYDSATRTWFSGRIVVLRAYFERPFLVSGDREAIGVVLATPGLGSDDKTQPLVSRWGADPTRPIAKPIQSSALTAENFLQANDSVTTCLLAEGGTADIKPYQIHFADDRQLWFADIPVNTLGSNAPFLRLAFVRWQPQAIHNTTVETRISQIVFADFIQLSPDRWVSIQRRSGARYVITVSGVFSPPTSPVAGPPGALGPTFTVELLSRWYALGKDTGWRKVDSNFQFSYAPASPQSSVSSWSAELDLPHSAFVRKYRIFIRESEWYVDRSNKQVSRVAYAQFIDLP